MKTFRGVQSTLDTDFYKLTMQQAYLHHYPDASSRWEFKCRSELDLAEFAEQIKSRLADLSKLAPTAAELNHLKQHYDCFSEDYLLFLKQFRFSPELLEVRVHNNELQLSGEGPLIHLSALEIPILATVSEVRNVATSPALSLEQVEQSTQAKIDFLKQQAEQHDLSQFRFVDFGTRRRLSYAVQRRVVEMFQQQLPDFFKGTSNPHLAAEFNLPCIGTMAHEWLQAFQAFVPIRQSQREALEVWEHEFRGKLAIALSDVITIDAFLADLDLYLVKLYDGFRQDSGDPLVWGEKILAHLEQLGIDPMTKTLVFSDSLNFTKAIEIYQRFSRRTKVVFGIGTWLTGDFGVNQPANVVMKLTQVNQQPVAKISDSPGKSMCRNQDYLKNLMSSYGVSDTIRNQLLKSFEN